MIAIKIIMELFVSKEIWTTVYSNKLKTYVKNVDKITI